jgi:hypothetical protein
VYVNGLGLRPTIASLKEVRDGFHPTTGELSKAFLKTV